MVHGGCWQSAVADRRIMNWIAEDFRGRGIAVWNIEYRGVDMDGGGYPGTFLDVAAAADALRAASRDHPLVPGPYVAIGHSAGGHLALWLAARSRLPEDSVLRTADPLTIASVISLGGLPDLEEAARPPGSGCGTEVVAKLVGSGRADPWVDTSLPRLAPIGVEQLLVNGKEDRIIPGFYAEAYAGQMRAKGDIVEVHMIDETGHVELIAPESPAWAVAAGLVAARLGR
jgi:acetyl esterase/lipase